MTEPLPRKILQEITLACVQLEQSYDVLDLAQVAITEGRIKALGYDVPAWFKLMFGWKMRNPVLSTEESFRRRYTKSDDPPYIKDTVTGRLIWNFRLENFSLNQSFKRILLNKEILELWVIIRELYEENGRHQGYQQALWGIVGQIVSGDGGTEDGLNFEFHCKTTENPSLLEPRNKKMIKDMLIREGQFWQNDYNAPKLRRQGITAPAASPPSGLAGM